MGKTTNLTMLDEKLFTRFVHPGEVVEIRVPKIYGKHPAWNNEYAKGNVGGYFDDFKLFSEAVKRLKACPFYLGIYFTLQVIDTRLLARAYNKIKVLNQTTADTNVLQYRWLPIDIDPVRPAGISSSGEELQAALQTRKEIEAYMVQEYDFTPPLRGMSGNGGHLLFELPDLEITEKNKEFIKAILAMLSNKFTDAKVSVDTTVFNPARIWKLYGTLARKGDEVPAQNRFFRESYVEAEDA